MNDQPVVRQLFREAVSAGHLKFQFLSRIFTKPGRNFKAADVVAHAVMGAALGNQHPIPVLQLFDGRHTLQRLREKALVPGHEDGEGAERHLPGHNGAHHLKGLTVGDHQTDVIRTVLIHERNRILKLLRLTAERPGMIVENLRQHHLLRQYQSSLGGRAVHRDHQNE